jgi:hypothetical protein
VEDRFEKITCKSGEVNLLPLIMAQMIQSELIWVINCLILFIQCLKKITLVSRCVHSKTFIRLVSETFVVFIL